MFWNVSVKLKLHVECAEKSIQRPSPKLAVYYLFSTTICSKLGAYLFYTKTLWHHPSLSSLPPFGHAFLSIKPRGFLEQLHAASAAALKKAVESEASDVESLGFDEEASPEATGSLVLDGWCLLSGWISDKRKCWPVFFSGKDSRFVDFVQWRLVFFSGDLKIWEIRVQAGTWNCMAWWKKGQSPITKGTA